MSPVSGLVSHSYPPTTTSLASGPRKGWVVTPGPPTGWHPKLTVYRFALTTITLALGTAKALSPSPVGSVTIEWVGGLVFFLMVFFLSYCDANGTAKPKWLFQADLMDNVREAFLRAGVRIPLYETASEPEARSVGRKKRPSITGYRLLVSATALSFGTIKAYLSYTGNETASKGVEWVYGSIMSLCLYWLGLYESSPRWSVPWLFKDNYDTFLFCWSLGVLLALGAGLMTGFFPPMLDAISTTYGKGGWHLFEAIGLIGVLAWLGAMCGAAFCSSLYWFWIPVEEPLRMSLRRLGRRWRR